ncbi:hypothetical protein, partial [Alloprevotella tannerae]|uniref:hypothetical protein n=1 Tax=Alloprevotella tannerae TaxID=76122 RepID=UPI0028F1459D
STNIKNKFLNRSTKLKNKTKCSQPKTLNYMVNFNYIGVPNILECLGLKFHALGILFPSRPE